MQAVLREQLAGARNTVVVSKDIRRHLLKFGPQFVPGVQEDRCDFVRVTCAGCRQAWHSYVCCMYACMVGDIKAAELYRIRIGASMLCSACKAWLYVCMACICVLHVGRAGGYAMQGLPWFWLFYFWHLCDVRLCGVGLPCVGVMFRP